MKESFRSTKPISEFSFNVLHRLNLDEAKSPDHKELLELGLVEQSERAGIPWWDVRFTQIDGPYPTFDRFVSVIDEFDAIGCQLIRWIEREGVKPSDICIVYMGKKALRRIEGQFASKLSVIGIKIEVQVRGVFTFDDQTIVTTSPHSFKGYDSEIVVIPSVEKFQLDGKVFSRPLYVAMTRSLCTCPLRQGFPKRRRTGDSKCD